jgi:superoxide dismutase, Cu-Zn family
MKPIMLAVAMLSLLGAGLPVQAELRTADAEISGCTDPTITGHAQLTELPSREGVKQVLVQLTVRGLPDGKHGVHIHQTANCDPCTAAGGHFDPGLDGNPSPDGNHPFHSGDLINIDVREGRGVLFTLTSRVTLAPGPLSIFDADGSAFIIHEQPDTYCPQGAIQNCAGGGRAACGIIVSVDE